MKSKGKISKKFMLIAVFLFVAGFTVMSFMGKQSEKMPGPKGNQVWKYITQTSPYTNWDYWPGLDGMYKGQSPHGAFLKLYVNEEARAALQRGDKTIPENAIIVKENYNKQKKLMLITPMYKVKGYNPDAGNWFWAKYKVDGEIMAEGKVGSCIKCHSAVAGDDYMYTVSKMKK